MSDVDRREYHIATARDSQNFSRRLLKLDQINNDVPIDGSIALPAFRSVKIWYLWKAT
ncbi:hypothetical protein [Myxosarcina sp. GI1(2024)]